MARAVMAFRLKDRTETQTDIASNWIKSNKGESAPGIHE